MRYFLFCITLLTTSLATAYENHEVNHSISIDETDDIYWETPEYLSKLENEETNSKVQYVYHYKANNFVGDWIVPLNMMPYMDGFSDIYKRAISKYKGREHLLELVIPTLNCLWNDVVFLSPIHPNKQYKEHIKIGFTPNKAQFFKIPVEVLEEKRLTVWKWLSNKKYPYNDPIHESSYSYCEFNFSHYQELDELPYDTKEFYQQSFNSENPAKCPPFTWYRIPHILCQDPIDLLDGRITIINWEDDPQDIQVEACD